MNTFREKWMSLCLSQLLRDESNRISLLQNETMEVTREMNCLKLTLEEHEIAVSLQCNLENERSALLGQTEELENKSRHLQHSLAEKRLMLATIVKDLKDNPERTLLEYRQRRDTCLEEQLLLDAYIDSLRSFVEDEKRIEFQDDICNVECTQ